MRNQGATELLRKRIARLLSDPAGLAYEFLDAAGEQEGACNLTGRAQRSEVVLIPRLRRALECLNPEASASVIDKAILDLTSDRSLLGAFGANRDIYNKIRDRIKVDAGQGSRREERDMERQISLRIIDWEEPANNDFLLVANLWIYGQMGNQNVGLVGFVNGLPLILLEMGIVNNLQELHESVISDYRRNLPQLFWYNAFIIISDGRRSRIGSFTASWEFYFGMETRQ